MDYLVDHSLFHNMNYGCSKIYVDKTYVGKNYVVKLDKNSVVEGPR